MKINKLTFSLSLIISLLIFRIQLIGAFENWEFLTTNNIPMRLTDAEISQQLDDLPNWQVNNQHLQRTFQFTNFIEAIAFVNQLVEPAEKLGHHPDITIIYNKVTVSITTHDAGGLTKKDFELARMISEIAKNKVIN